MDEKSDGEIMKKAILLIILVTIAYSQEAIACQCAANPPFLTAIKTAQAKTIALVKIRRYLTYFDHPHGNTYVLSMEAEIEEVYGGNETRKKITIWGTNGANCLEYLSEFEINKYYVVALFERGSSEYNLSNCGEFWLSVDERKETATGKITDETKAIKLDELKAKLQSDAPKQFFLEFDFIALFFTKIPLLY